MRKTVLEKPAVDGEGTEKVGVVTHHPDHQHVFFDGLVWPDGDFEEQGRKLLAFVATVLERLGGGPRDVVATRYFVREESLTGEARETLRALREELWGDAVHAGYTVGVADLLVEGARFELDVEAKIPDGDRRVETKVL